MSSTAGPRSERIRKALSPRLFLSPREWARQWRIVQGLRVVGVAVSAALAAFLVEDAGTRVAILVMIVGVYLPITFGLLALQLRHPMPPNAPWLASTLADVALLAVAQALFPSLSPALIGFPAIVLVTAVLIGGLWAMLIAGASVAGLVAAVVVGRDPQPGAFVVTLAALLLVGMAYVLGRMAEEQRRLAGRDRENAERLQDLDRLKSEFVATVSHELRTPLTAVVGFASTLRSRWPELTPEVRQEFLDRLSDNARGLEHLITHLLDFGRLERGEFRLETQDHDLRELVDRIRRNMVHELVDHEVVTDVPSGLMVKADAHAFERILGNLLSNAAKFSPRGTRIEIAGRPEGSGVVLAVRDHGPGIPEEALPRVFERFYRGTQTTRGTGIGLAVVKDLVELHGGTVEGANASPGTVVTVRLPNVLPAARATSAARDSTLPT